MIILNCEQGSAQWLGIRNGIPTASRFKDIITSQGKPAAGRKGYMHDLLGERITRNATQIKASYAMERGTALEPLARAWYELETGNEVAEVGFVIPDKARRWGCSPDGLTAEGGVEIKCPMIKGMISKLLADKIPAEYYVQIQAGMWICERSTWDFVLYSEDRNVPPMIKTADRNDEFIAEMSKQVTAFCDLLDEKEEWLRTRYDIEKPKAVDINELPTGAMPF